MSRAVARVTAALGAALLLAAAACTTKQEGCPKNAACAQPPGRLTAGSWQRIPSPPGGARQEVAAAVIDKKIYLVGGLLSDGRPTARVEAFDTAASKWSKVADLPIAIHHAMAATLGGELFVLGGFPDHDLVADRASARVFKLRRDSWIGVPDLRRPRAAGAAVAVGNEIVVVGGISDSKHVERAEMFDGTSWRDGAVMPHALDHIGAATDGSSVYVVGGRAVGKHFADFQRFDAKANSWTELDHMPTPRSGLGAAFIEGALIAIGGEGGRIFPEVEAYDFFTKKWRRLDDLRTPRHGVGVVAVGSKVYALVGGDRPGISPSAFCESMPIARIARPSRSP